VKPYYLTIDETLRETCPSRGYVIWYMFRTRPERDDDDASEQKTKAAESAMP